MNKRRPSAKDTTLKVKVVPRSSMNRIAGLQGDTLRVSVTSPPVDGSANQDMMRLLSRGLGVRKDRIEILSGHRSRLKTIRIHGMTKEELLLLLNS
jgi:uncharacterized protein (TIGR00251 family)